MKILKIQEYNDIGLVAFDSGLYTGNTSNDEVLSGLVDARIIADGHTFYFEPYDDKTSGFLSMGDQTVGNTTVKYFNAEYVGPTESGIPYGPSSGLSSPYTFTDNISNTTFYGVGPDSTISFTPSAPGVFNQILELTAFGPFTPGTDATFYLYVDGTGVGSAPAVPRVDPSPFSAGFRRGLGNGIV